MQAAQNMKHRKIYESSVDFDAFLACFIATVNANAEGRNQYVHVVN